MTPYLLSLLYNLMVFRASTNISLFNKYDYQIMARINIDIGALGNPATGDTLRTAMTKINTNFEEIYQIVGDPDTGLITTSITNGDVTIQPNGTGNVEIDQVQFADTTLSTLTTNSDLTLSANGTGGVAITPTKIIMANLPTSDPSNAGQLWNDSGTLKVSAG
jgi:hypothetical protein